MIDLIKDQFHSQEDVVRMEEQRIQKYSLKKNLEQAEQEENKKRFRKQKEMEIKQFQDIQVEAKYALREEEEKQKAKDHVLLKTDVEKFQKEAQRRKEEIIKRNKAHQQVVLEQMKEEHRTFAKTGIAIIS